MRVARAVLPAAAAGPAAAVLAAALTLGCARFDPPPAETLPPNSFAFGVFGDAPYQPWEQGRYRRLLADVDRTPIEWFIHLGDLFWYRCSNEAYELKARELRAVAHPVIYTPGDNEWSDCHDLRSGRYDPLDRLAELRRVFFAEPGVSLGNPRLELETQAADSAFAGFPENVRWRRGGFVFATLHLVGSRNAMEPFRGRPAASDVESATRLRADLAWMRAAFDTARATGAKGVVIVFHAEIGLDPARLDRPGEGYEELTAELGRAVATYAGQVILIHGDSHYERVDHPLNGPDGKPIERFTRIESFGSPDVGWVRVVVDSVAGRVVRVEPRRFRGWW